MKFNKIYHLKDEIAKLKGGFTLDLNLERNRSNEKVINLTYLYPENYYPLGK